MYIYKNQESPMHLFKPIREGLKKRWIYPHLGGWVVQDGDKIHKKNTFYDTMFIG